MTIFNVKFRFAGVNGDVVTRTLRTIDYAGADVGADLILARAAADALIPLWEAVTNSGVLGFSIVHDVVNAGTPGGVLNNTANVNIYTEDVLPNGKHNTFPLNIPAVTDALMVGATGESYDQVDITDSDLQDLVAALASDFRFSDGELIDDAEGTGGVKNGYRVLKGKRYST